MSDSQDSALEVSPGGRPVPVRGTYEVLLGVAALSFVGFVAFVCAFGVWGENVVAGLENACAEAEFDAANHLRAEGHTDLAIKRFRVAMSGHFRRETTRHMCGRALGDLLKQEQRYDEAIEVYQSLPPAAFDFAGAYAGYVDALFQEGRHEEARELGLEWLKRAEAEGAREQMEWANAILFHITREAGDGETALAYGYAAVAANPASDLGLPLAVLLHERGDARGAREQLDAFLGVTGNAKLRLEAQELRDRWSGAP